MNNIYVLLGMVMGYSLWNIVHILRTEKKMKKFNSLMDNLKKDIDNFEPKAEDPILTAHHTLTKVLNFPESKAVLYKNNNALAIAYGHSCVVIIDRPTASAIAIGIGIDKTTKQSKEERDEEFKQLKELLESCNFNGDNFSSSLALLVTKLSHADLTKYTHLHRQIPHDML
ncbi:MAG: hypothetical protein EOL95_09065 [Bacteroidia bacterium]|nr:hypothetical protein [Bacteroidia bacterium]